MKNFRWCRRLMGLQIVCHFVSVVGRVWPSRSALNANGRFVTMTLVNMWVIHYIICISCSCNLLISIWTFSKDTAHVDWECPIFASANHSPNHLTTLDYSAIEVLRCLLLRSKNPEKWVRILQFESHAESRRLNPTANQDTEFFLNFIKEKCRLTEYDSEIIERVSGICAVNAFWGFKDLEM